MSKTTTTHTTEVVLRDGSRSVVPAAFAENYPGFAPDEETLELFQENLGDVEIGIGSFRRVKVPSSDSKSWIITTAGNDEAVKMITGILAAWSARRSFWLNGDPDGSRPDCSSVNNREPIPGGLFAPGGERAEQNPSGKCAECPMAQFGSELPRNGRESRGTACHEQRLFYLVRPGELFPTVVHVPRTSLRNAQGFMIDLLQQGLRYWQVEIGMSLTQDKTKDGQAYNKVEFSLVRKLEPEEAAAVRAYSNEIKSLVDRLNASFDTASVTDVDGGYSVSEPAPA